MYWLTLYTLSKYFLFMKNYFVLKKKNIMNETYHLVRRDEFDNQLMPMAAFSICHWPSNTMNFKPLQSPMFDHSK